MTVEEMVTAAKEYTVWGFVIHPLSKPDDKGNSPGKKPVITKWQTLTATPKDIDYYIKKGYNLGLVCGKASNVTVLDFDNLLFADQVFDGSDVETLRSNRTKGRGHVYFKYNPNLPASKHHDLGIEVLSDGNNAVLPPSVHASGDVYHWNDSAAPILEMPEVVHENLKELFKTEAELKQILGKCRTCFKSVLKDKKDMHGAEGREYMIAVSTDLKAAGATDAHIKMFARLMYGKDYDEARTLQEWGNIDPGKTWKCETLKAKLSAFVDLDQCDKCEKHKEKKAKRRELPQKDDSEAVKDATEKGNDGEKRLHPINFDGIIGHEDLKKDILYAVLGKLNNDDDSKAYLKSIDYHATEGILIYGVPGLGKSDILRAVGESVKGHPDIDCKYMSCSDFQGNVGTNAEKIDAVFEEARATPKKCCIMLIDEIDSVMMKKKGHLNVAERTNAMQTNMDGIKDSSKIIVIATTNRINGMENASLSRFTLITLQLPTLNERIEFVKKYISPIPTDVPIPLETMANITEGFTGRMFRDLGVKLNKIRAITKIPVSSDDLTRELTKYMSVASRNKKQTNEDEDDNSLKCSNASYIDNNVTYNKRQFSNLDSSNNKTHTDDSLNQFKQANYNQIKTQKEGNITDLDPLQQFMQDNYSHMKNPDIKSEMDYRTMRAVNSIKTRFKFTEEKAAFIWQDYCKVRGWVSPNIEST